MFPDSGNPKAEGVPEVSGVSEPSGAGSTGTVAELTVSSSLRRTHSPHPVLASRPGYGDMFPSLARKESRKLVRGRPHHARSASVGPCGAGPWMSAGCFSMSCRDRYFGEA